MLAIELCSAHIQHILSEIAYNLGQSFQIIHALKKFKQLNNYSTFSGSLLSSVLAQRNGNCHNRRGMTIVNIYTNTT